MPALPAQDLRSNVGSLAVPNVLVPAVAHAMAAAYSPEEFDPAFRGQDLETSYLDTPAFDLRKSRQKGDRYLTLRIRCYAAPGRPEEYALSAKTEAQKFRLPLPAAEAENILAHGLGGAAAARYLRGALLARLLDLAGAEPLQAVVRVCCRRYAVENEEDRLTLDLGVRTDTGKCLPAAVLEFKSTDANSPMPAFVQALQLRPVKVSKFLWATDWR